MIKNFQTRFSTFTVTIVLFASFYAGRDVLSQNSSNHPVITFDFNAAPVGTISPSLLGANNPMTDLPSRAEYNINTKQFPPGFYGKMQALGLRSLRFPGGNNSGSYHWQDGIGPYAERSAGFNGSTGTYDPDYYLFGFIEFMDFLDEIGGSDPIICINFGTGTAEEASAWVEFANAEVGTDPNCDGTDHAQLRAELGRPEPFGIRFWEIGNELGSPYKHMFSWHFGQLLDGGEDYTKTIRNYLFGGDQWQYRDMKERQDGQRVVQANNWNPSACRSDGGPNQVFYLKYPPVKTDSLHLGVWTDSLEVEEWHWIDDLDNAGSDAMVFTLDSLTGQITFGDGDHGQIPPEDASIRVVYKSIQKKGLIDFYEQMKRVDPTILIGVPFSDSTFYQEVSSAGFDELPFDFIVDHPYESGRPDPLEEEHWRIQWAAQNNAATMTVHQENLNNYFTGLKNIGIVVSEYNLTYMPHQRDGPTNNPWYGGQQLHFFGRSLDNGLYIAGALISFLRTAEPVRLWALDIHSLVPDDDSYRAGWPLTALMGPKPYQYLNPSGHVYSLFSRCCGYNIIEPQLSDVPTYRVGVDKGRGSAIDSVDLPYLDVLGFQSTTGDTAVLFVLNRSSKLPEADEAYDDITATVKFENSCGQAHVLFYEFNSENIWSINSHEYPECVSVSVVNEQAFTDSFEYTYPSHSLTMIMVTKETTEVEEARKKESPYGFQLMQNYPNPFNPTTTINFSLPQRNRVTLKVFNLLGEEVFTLVEGELPSGKHSIIFDAAEMASGIYFYQLKTTSFMKLHKMILLR